MTATYRPALSSALSYRDPKAALTWLEEAFGFEPVMVILDAFVLSHTAEAVELPEQELVDSFLPERFAPYVLDTNNPSAFGGLLIADYYQDVRKKLHDAQKAAFPLMERIEDEWEKLTGRHYGMLDEYRCEDADIILMTMATASSTSRVVVDSLRAQGLRVGRLSVKMFRPFPAEQLRKRLARRDKVVILDRNCSYGSDGILFSETKSALYALPVTERPKVYGYISGLGGRDLTPELIASTVHLSGDQPDFHSVWIK